MSHKINTKEVPKFKIETTYDLIEELSKMGISLAFDPDHADFTKISDMRLYVTGAIHKAFVNVNEKGTEAAAATGVTGEMGLISTYTFRADHPFVFLIYDDNTGLILFMERVADPSV